MARKFETVEQEFSELLKTLNIQESDSLIYQISEIWKKNIHNLYFPPIIEQCLQELRKEFKLVLLTNTDSFSYDFVKMRYSIENYFDSAIKSFESGKVKPDATMFNQAIENLQLKPNEVMMCGDSPFNDILPAKQIGMKTLMVDTKRIFIGFNQADFTVNTIKDFVDRLNNLKQIEFDSRFVGSK